MKNKTKRKLGGMSFDEFMEHELSTSGKASNKPRVPPTNGEELPSKNAKRRSESKEHKQGLEKLKQNDPEFYQYLAENDSKLLDFEASSGDDEEEDSHLVEDKNSYVDTLSEVNLADDLTAKEEDMDGVLEDFPDDDQCTGDEPARTPVTLQLIKEWGLLVEKKPLHAIRTIAGALHCAIVDLFGASKSKSPARLTFSVKGDQVFDTLARLCLTQFKPVMDSLLKAPPTLKRRKKWSPASSVSWGKVRLTVKTFLGDVIQLLEGLTEPVVLCHLLRLTAQLSAYFLCFPKTIKHLIKALVALWSSGKEEARVLSFLVLRDLVFSKHKLLERILKMMYSTYVRQCQTVLPATQPQVVLMQNCLVEMLAMDHGVSYQHGFVCIRQLATYLRNALSGKKDGYRLVYNWQFVSCIQLWCRALSEIKSETLQPLIYPVAQIAVGATKLVQSARFFPLHLQILQALIHLIQGTAVYIPVIVHLLEILDSHEMNKRTKPSTQKSPLLHHLIKVKNDLLDTRVYQDAVVDAVLSQILEFFVCYAYSIAFPELVFPACRRLRQFIKKTLVIKYKKQVRQIVDKLEEASNEVLNRRLKVTFSPKDVQDVELWESEYKQAGPNSLAKFHSTWSSMRKAMLLQLETGAAQAVAEKTQSVSSKPKATPSAHQPPKSKATAPDVEVPPPPKRQKKVCNKQPKSGVGKKANMSADDILEDLVLSD